MSDTAPTPALAFTSRMGNLLKLRDRLLVSRRFQEWAAACPLTRPIARRRARALFDLCAGFVYSQVLSACVRLGVFQALAQGPLSVQQVAQRVGLTVDAAERLLISATSLKLVSRRGADGYGLGELGAAVLANPGVVAMVEHHTILYRDLADPVALLRGETRATGLGAYWSYARSDQPADLQDTQVAEYTHLMAASQSMIANEILASYPLGKHRCLLDVAGGDGSFLVAAASRAPRLELCLFDLPPVAALAEQRFARQGLQQRARAVGGDLYRDALPGGADVISLVRVIHDHDDAAAQAILRSVKQALPKGGVVVLAEPMSESRGAEAISDAYFGFYLMAMGQGRLRTPAMLAQMLRDAGFQRVKRWKTRMPMLVSVLTARVPG